MTPPPADAHVCPHEPRIALLEGGVNRIWEVISKVMDDSNKRYEVVIRMEGKIDRLGEKLDDHIAREEPYLARCATTLAPSEPKTPERTGFFAGVKKELFGLAAKAVAVLAFIYFAFALQDLSKIMFKMAEKVGGM